MSAIERSYLAHEGEGVVDAFEHMRHDLPNVSEELIFDYWLSKAEDKFDRVEGEL